MSGSSQFVADAAAGNTVRSHLKRKGARAKPLLTERQNVLARWNLNDFRGGSRLRAIYFEICPLRHRVHRDRDQLWWQIEIRLQLRGQRFRNELERNNWAGGVDVGLKLNLTARAYVRNAQGRVSDTNFVFVVQV